MNYHDFYTKSINDRALFWREQSDQITWYKPPINTLSSGANGYPEWFSDGELNMSYLCVDKHIEDGYGDEVAIYYDSPVTNTKQAITYFKLYDEVAKLAGGLIDLGLKKGDTAIIYMPMIPQAVYAMLACARIGVTHSVVFGGFAPHELAIRIDDCKPKVIITASSGKEIDKIIPYKPFVDEAINKSKHKPSRVITYQRKLQQVAWQMKSYDVDYEQLTAHSELAKPVSVPANHPLYILYTSGTTGTPKGIVRDTGGYATALKFSMKYIYGLNEGEAYWAASDVGWVVGHSYIVYGPLINRNTTVLFEGKPIKTPDASTFWRIISEYKVKVMFTAPTAIRAIKKEDPDGEWVKRFDLSSLKYQFLAGERCDAATLKWAEEHLNVPVIDHWWQTESGWPMLANMVGVNLQKVKPGSATFPVCGYDIQILNEDGTLAAANTEGYVAIKLPLPPGNLLTLWGNQDRFYSGYLQRFPGYYFSGDGGYRDNDGYIFITGRVDDIINVAGHRLSTAEMEEIVAGHAEVAECAVFGVKCELKGEKPLGIIVLKNNQLANITQIKQETILRVRQEIGAVASFRDVLIAERLPKTRSGKILRKLLRAIADGEDVSVPSTIDDPLIIEEIKGIFSKEDNL